MLSLAQEILEATAALAEERNLKVTLANSAKGALIAGMATLLGGILGGKKGLVAGAAVGGIGAASMLSDFKSVGAIIRQDLTESQRQKLYHDVVRAVRNVKQTDVAAIVPMLASATNPDIQQAVLSTVTSFISREMQMSVVE